MKRGTALISLAAVLLLGQGFQTARPAVAPEDRWRRAVDAWETGDYPTALPHLIALMKSSAAAEYVERVAALSGEVFRTTEITADGRNPRISPDGQLVSFEAGPPSATVTPVVRVDPNGPRAVADLPGVSAAFDALSRQIVYLRPVQNAQWVDAVKALDEARTAQERQAPQAVVNFLLGKGELIVRDLVSGQEHVVPTGTLLKTVPMFSGSRILFIGADPADLARSEVYAVEGTQPPVKLTDQAGHKANVLIDPRGTALVYSNTATAPFREPTAPAGRGGRGAPAAATSAPAPVITCGAGGGRGGAAVAQSFRVVDLAAKTTRAVAGSGVTMSADGSTIAWLARTTDACTLNLAPALSAAPKTLQTAARLDAPSLSADGRLVAYQTMLPGSTNWEVFVSDGTAAPRRVTRDIQHDVLPRFLTNGTLLGMMGEPRHRRSHLYDLATERRTRLFANNTLRTISPEYIWQASDDGRRLLIQAERDGDTISVERGVYVVDLTTRVTVAEILDRLQRQLTAESDLRQQMTRAYAPLLAPIKTVTSQISAGRVYEYEKAQFDFDSKHITQPGNAKAIEYLNKTYASFGYTPDLQWFTTAGQQPVRTANVIATLKGTKYPELIYVVSSHFDSVAGGPGADDDTSGTCALLETARVLAKTPLPATVMFASFTGEEGGLLGSREFVRLAAQNKWKVVGALNNDMIGWAGEGSRMDNTIRFSNAGIRDLQHGAAFLFSKLITYDARYYRGTDANSFFDAWGDIVGGIGSYPILGNPNYHQPSDVIETINFQQVAETAKVTTATIMHLASSPSRLKDVRLKPDAASGRGLEVTWTPSPETDVTGYIVAYGKDADPSKLTRLRVTGPKASLPALPAGATVAVKAVNARGLEGWDWAATVVR